MGFEDIEWENVDGNGRFFCDKCQVFHSRDPEPAEAREIMRAKQLAGSDKYIEAEGAQLDHELRTFFLSSECVEMEVRLGIA